MFAISKFSFPKSLRPLPGAAFLVLAWISSAAGQPAKQVRLGPLFGDDVVTLLSEIGDDGSLTTDGAKQMHLADFRILEFSEHQAASKKDSIVVSTTGGGVLFAESVTLVEDRCEIKIPAGTVSLPIERIKSIELQPDPSSEIYRRALTSPDPDFDKVLVKSDGQYQAASVIIDSLNAETVNFEYGEQKVSLPREKVYAIVIANAGASGRSTQPAKVILTDGSSLMCQIDKLQQGRLHVQLDDSETVPLDWNWVARIEMNSEKIQYLSELEPLFEKQTPIVTLPRKWQRDASVDGHPLQLRSEEGESPRVFAKGIGTHSMSELVFENGADFTHLAAVIGIDIETNGRGDCLFVVIAHGKELFSRRVKGTDAPYEMLVDIRRSKEIAILVKPGEELDLADHANWCDLRFLKLDP